MSRELLSHIFKESFPSACQAFNQSTVKVNRQKVHGQNVSSQKVNAKNDHDKDNSYKYT